MEKKTVIARVNPDVNYPTGEYPDNSPKVSSKPEIKLTPNERHFLTLQYRILRIANSQDIAKFISDQLKQGVHAYDIAVQTPCSLNDILLIESLLKEIKQVAENIDLDKIEQTDWAKAMGSISKTLISKPKNKKKPLSFENRRSFKDIKKIGNYKKGGF